MVKQTKELKQTHGRNDEFVPTTLDQIFGETGLSKYGTMDENVYTARLAEMNKSDLHAHAARFGIMPIDNRDRLVKTLLKEFKLYVHSFQKPQPIAQPKKISKEVEKILAEGR